MAQLPNQLPKVIHTVDEMIQWRQKNQNTVGLTPTMGALHDGHAQLMREVRPLCEVSVLTLFVNPTQFGPKEDFSKYPRSFEKDLELAAREGVDVVFAPTSEEIYPTGYSTYVEETQLSQVLCGKFRPVFFRGVTTVVLKLFNLIRPDVAVFGLKDAQQFFVIKKMVQDLHIPIQIKGIPTVRESDGLALSSRNVYLTAEERKTAPQIFQELERIKASVEHFNSAANHVSDEIEKALHSSKTRLERLGFQVQYLDCLALPQLNSSFAPEESCLIAIAAYLGNTRLIDNIIIPPRT